MRGEALDHAEVDESGIPGDRSSALFAQGGARVGKTYRGKEHDRLHLLSSAEAAIDAAALRGVVAKLRRGAHFFDDAPISVLVDCWLNELSAFVGYRVEWERFRPNFFVRAPADYIEQEPELVDAELALGTVRLRVRGPIERCVTTTYHPQGKPSDPRILQFLASRRNACIGIYCDVVTAGVARVGDPLIRIGVDGRPA